MENEIKLKHLDNISIIQKSVHPECCGNFVELSFAYHSAYLKQESQANRKTDNRIQEREKIKDDAKDGFKV